MAKKVSKVKMKVKAKSNIKISKGTKAKSKSKTASKAKLSIKSTGKPKSNLKKNSNAKAKTATKAKPKIAAKNSKNSKITNESSLKSALNWQNYVSPLDDRIIIQVQAVEKVTPAGLILLETAEASGNQRGVVVAVGRGHLNKFGKIKPLELQIGDRVLISGSAGDEIEILGHKAQILRESDVLGVLD